ncbi:MAG: hypothetical protein HYT80_09510 [Euryarchaeota archaeon]|nr:hypothetical protein [Euryarchaeota archaeon]
MNLRLVTLGLASLAPPSTSVAAPGPKVVPAPPMPSGATRPLRKWAFRHKAKLKQWLDASPSYLPYPLLNRLGLQVIRVLAAWWRYALRRQRNHPELAQHEAALDREGIAVIRDFLPSDDFAALAAAYAEFGHSGRVTCVRNKDGTGVDWYTGRIDCGYEKSAAERMLSEKIARHPAVLNLAEHVLRRSVKEPPTLSYQRLVVEHGYVDDKDVEGVLHSDRYYPCVKMAFYVNAQEEANGAYVYCRGSHRRSMARLRHEYEYSVRESRFLLGKKSRLDPKLMERGRPRISDEHTRAMDLSPSAIVAPANTLVVSNNIGFHRRGTISPGRERQQIRIIFYYVQRPWYGRLAARLFFRGRDPASDHPDAMGKMA